jgi:hypothetical protein
MTSEHENFVVDDNRIKALARIVHEANKAFCESIGDTSQVSWSEAPEYNHRSAMIGVKAICDNTDITPEESHDVWMEAKKADGWVYGEVKDKEKKTHPSIVPYKDLSISEKYKDFLVRDIVLSYINFRKMDHS